MPPSAVVPDRRPAHLVKGLTDLLDGAAGAQLTSDEMAGARELERRLPGMIEELSACGLPDTFVHGDFHPGNWRSDGKHTVLIDFADAYVGHPAFDGERLREFIDEERREPVAEAWCAAWAEHAPESDPKRALHLARPLQALSGAILYQQFLDNIETSERRYHELDPPAGIRDAIAATFE
jgi:Ser/Thr protein kinase RdoA (MazF antagonist)